MRRYYLPSNNTIMPYMSVHMAGSMSLLWSIYGRSVLVSGYKYIKKNKGRLQEQQTIKPSRDRGNTSASWFAWSLVSKLVIVQDW